MRWTWWLQSPLNPTAVCCKTKERPNSSCYLPSLDSNLRNWNIFPSDVVKFAGDPRDGIFCIVELKETAEHNNCGFENAQDCKVVERGTVKRSTEPRLRIKYNIWSTTMASYAETLTPRSGMIPIRRVWRGEGEISPRRNMVLDLLIVIGCDRQLYTIWDWEIRGQISPGR